MTRTDQSGTCAICKRTMANVSYLNRAGEGRTCASCHRAWRVANEPGFLEQDRHRSRERYRANPEPTRQASRDLIHNRPAERMLHTARARAKREGWNFNLTIDDIQIPSACPVLGIPLEVGRGKARRHSPSLDRLDSSKGYVRGNVRVISWRANDLKRDGTLTEFRALLKYLEESQEYVF